MQEVGYLYSAEQKLMVSVLFSLHLKIEHKSSIHNVMQQKCKAMYEELEYYYHFTAKKNVITIDPACTQIGRLE